MAVETSTSPGGPIARLIQRWRAAPRPRGWRRQTSRIVVRMLAFNVLVVFLPVAGLFYLGSYAEHLLDAQERAMVQQGRLLAAALAAQDSFDDAVVTRVLRDLNGRVDARLRIITTNGRVIGDTSSASAAGGASAPSSVTDAGSGGSYASRAEAGARTAVSSVASATSDSPESKAARERLLYRLGAAIARAGRAVRGVVVPNRGSLSRSIAEPMEMRDPQQVLHAPEIRAALAGRYGSATRLTPGQRSVTLFSAIPIRRGDAVVGAVLVSESTYRLLQALYDVRLRIFEVIVLSLIAAAVLSMIVAATIARPLRRLQADAATVLDHRGRLTRGFRGTARWDEIGDLARALEALATRVDQHLRFVESFSADLSHEFKNPLASIRTVADILGSIEDPHERQRFVDRLLRDLTRLERLLAGVQEIVSIDTQLERDPVARVDLNALLANILDAHRLRIASATAPTSTSTSSSANSDSSGNTVTNTGIRLRLDASDSAALHVRASPERLAQVFDNLVDNAVSFSPVNGLVTVTLARRDGHCHVTVADDGPGIPEAHLARVFERFFSYRPSNGGNGNDSDRAPRDRHTGLGLSIARAIVESYGGTIEAGNRPAGGARIDVLLPGA